MNTPALDGGARAALMYDLRARDLQAQALDAIHGHAKSTAEPTREQLDAIALFERTNDRFFSSAAIRTHARGGPQPELPAGTTESERRGRLFFLDKAVAGTKQGMCGQCHSGPNLNEVSELGTQEIGFTAGSKFATALVAETNTNHDPVYTFRVDDGAGDVRLVRLPDPGIMLTDRQSSPHLAAFQPLGTHPALNAGLFKTPSLWGVRLTPPYFHDNSANTLREVVDHYGDVLFKRITFRGVFVPLTEQDREDIVAFLKLL
jgi:cytochrome c peroxidase